MDLLPKDEDGGEDKTNWDGIDRRNQDVSLLRLAILERDFSKHVKHCSKLQIGVLTVCTSTFFWLVYHSPEFASYLGKTIIALPK